MAALTWELVDRTAEALGATLAQRRRWRGVGRQVPSAWRIRIAERLTEDGTPIALSSFDDLAPRPGRIGGAS